MIIKYVLLPELESERLILRELNEGDVEDLSEWFGLDEIYKYWGRPASRGEKNPKCLFVEERPNVKRKPSHDFKWGVVNKSDNKLIGVFEIFDVENDRMGQIAYRFHPKYQNMGFCTECLNRVIKFVFEETKMDRLYARANVLNIPSNRVLEKCGFTKEGCIRNGKMVSEYCTYNIYGYIRSDYSFKI